jgi:hypothetical protein
MDMLQPSVGCLSTDFRQSSKGPPRPGPGFAGRVPEGFAAGPLLCNIRQDDALDLGHRGGMTEAAVAGGNDQLGLRGCDPRALHRHDAVGAPAAVAPAAVAEDGVHRDCRCCGVQRAQEGRARRQPLDAGGHALDLVAPASCCNACSISLTRVSGSRIRPERSAPTLLEASLLPRCGVNKKIARETSSRGSKINARRSRL